MTISHYLDILEHTYVNYRVFSFFRYPSPPLAYVINENQTAIVQFNQTELKDITFKDFALNFEV